jgi:D-alanyl-lipoteichoic acid acyltransferase DltB (MBOAT superfamily)
MLFNSFIFLIFLAIVVPVYHFMSKRYRNIFLLGASYVFYGYWDWRFLSLILASTLLDFHVGRAIHGTDQNRRRQILLFLSVAGNLSLLGFFKYYNFFVDSFAAVSSTFGIQLDYAHINIILPVGISFYTFQTLSYTIDIYRRKLGPTDNFVNFALFVAFFPQLVAGPIERAKHLLPQIERKPTATAEDFREGLALITTGMFKKIMIGDTCGRIVDHIFADPTLYNSPELLMGLLLFAVQVYADFSGYSNIARGTARFLGIHIMVNFNQPYMSANITELWQRWHISLSSWLRDYVYISLGGNRKGTARTYLNIMFTMMLCGLWHGAQWTFVFWGFIQGFFLSVHKLILRGRRATQGFTYANPKGLVVYILKVVWTHMLFLFGLVFFRAQSFGNAWYILKKFIYWEPSKYTSQIVMIVFTYYLVTVAVDLIEYWTKDHAFLLRLRPAFRTGLYAATLCVTLLYLFQAEPYPFVYFQF